LRRIVRDSFALQTFEARAGKDWQAAYKRFQRLKLVS
jgi:hypothetical protein